MKNRPAEPTVSSAWMIDGVSFPQGTKFRSKYKGYVYYGKVNNGALEFKGKQFLSPSAAAFSITRNPISGWVFWDCKMPGHSSWTNIRKFKRR